MNAFEALAKAHPQHVETLTAHAAAYGAGTIVATHEGHRYEGFYTGIKAGDHAVVSEGPNGSGRVTVQALARGAHLLVYPTEFTPVPIAEWTEDEVKAAKAAAEVAAQAQMEKALASANGQVGAPAGDEHAIAALHKAAALRHFAFAAQILAEYHADPAWAAKAAALR